MNRSRFLLDVWGKLAPFPVQQSDCRSGQCQFSHYWVRKWSGSSVRLVYRPLRHRLPRARPTPPWRNHSEWFWLARPQHSARSRTRNSRFVMTSCVLLYAFCLILVIMKITYMFFVLDPANWNLFQWIIIQYIKSNEKFSKPEILAGYVKNKIKFIKPRQTEIRSCSVPILHHMYNIGIILLRHHKFLFTGYGAFYKDCFNHNPSFDNFRTPALAARLRNLYGNPAIDSDQE